MVNELCYISKTTEGLAPAISVAYVGYTLYDNYTKNQVMSYFDYALLLAIGGGMMYFIQNTMKPVESVVCK